MPIGKKFGAMKRNGIGPLLISHRYNSNIERMNIIRNSELTVRDLQLSNGLYYSAGVHCVLYFPYFESTYFCYLDYNHWQYTAQRVFDLQKFKMILEER